MDSITLSGVVAAVYVAASILAVAVARRAPSNEKRFME